MSSRFSLPLSRSIETIQHELRLMGAIRVLISSDLPVSSKGIPYAAARIGERGESGVAAWWVQPKLGERGIERVIACDKYRSAGENMAAIAHSIQAIRGLSRWGATDIVERAFAGFAALPPGDGSSAPSPLDWRDLFEISVAHEAILGKADLLAIVRSKHKALMLKAHPDHGGTTEQVMQLSEAFQAAERELGTDE
jgi:hypothetical protein